MSVDKAGRRAAEGVHAEQQAVDAHSQVPFYFRHGLFGFVQFRVNGADDHSWSGALDIEALGYSEISLATTGSGNSEDDEHGGGGGGGGGAAATDDPLASPSPSGKARASTVYCQVEVFETRSIIYMKLTQLDPQSVYTLSLIHI